MIKIKCMLDSSIDICKCRVRLYKNDILLIDECTNKYGYYCFNIEKGIYKLKISNKYYYPKIQYFSIFINNNDEEIIVNFNKKHPITVRLVDNYNLPIEKGRMIFWKMNK